MGLRPAQGDEKCFCSATTLNGSAALPFVISTEAERSGEICGSAALSWECFSTVESWVFGPLKVMKDGSCSATTVDGGTALPFVISTEAERSGGTCGFFPVTRTLFGGGSATTVRPACSQWFGDARLLLPQEPYHHSPPPQLVALEAQSDGSHSILPGFAAAPSP